MPKFIVLPWTGGETDAPVFATALAVARQFGSHLFERDGVCEVIVW